MTNRKPTSPSSIEDLLDRILLEEPAPTHAALQRWIARYPEHREPLARFFATWAVQEEHPDEGVAIDEARLGAAALEHALAILDRPPPRLSEVGRAEGLSDAELGARCDLDAGLVTMLDRRLVRLASIPAACLARLGEALDRGVEDVRRMLDGPPLVDAVRQGGGALANAGYSASAPLPPIALEFADAIRASALPEATKQRWLAAD
jgi:hypothetical protein